MLTTLRAELAILDQLALASPRYVALVERTNRKLIEFFQVPVLNYVEDIIAAETLIPSGWAHTVSEPVPGKFVVTLTDGQSILTSLAMNSAPGFNYLPVAICQVALMAKGGWRGEKATTTGVAAEVERLRTILREIENLRFHIRDTPLHHIIGFSEVMVNEHFGPLNPEYLDYAKHISINADIMHDMILEMRDIILVAFPEQRSQRRSDMLEGLRWEILGIGLSKSPVLWMKIAALNKRISRWLDVEARDYLGKPSDAALLVPDGWNLDIKEITPGRYLATLAKEDVVFTSNFLGRAPDGMNLPAAICTAALEATLGS